MDMHEAVPSGKLRLVLTFELTVFNGFNHGCYAYGNMV